MPSPLSPEGRMDMDPLDALQHAMTFLDEFLERTEHLGVPGVNGLGHLRTRVEAWMPALEAAEQKGIREIGG